MQALISVVILGGPIIGCLIHRVIKYRGYKDTCVRFSKKFVIMKIGLTVVVDCSPGGDRPTKIPYSMCVMANGYFGFKIIVARLQTRVKLHFVILFLPNMS